MGSFQGHLTSNACSVAQWAAVGALREANNDVIAMHSQFSKRKDLAVSLLKDMPLITFQEPQGAFYVWINIEKTFGKKHGNTLITDDSSFCSALLDSKYVAGVPGTAFMVPGYMRISYSNSTEEITEGMGRLKEFLEEIK
jgi:aspartate aminotransferase